MKTTHELIMGHQSEQLAWHEQAELIDRLLATRDSYLRGRVARFVSAPGSPTEVFERLEYEGARFRKAQTQWTLAPNKLTDKDRTEAALKTARAAIDWLELWHEQEDAVNGITRQ